MEEALHFTPTLAAMTDCSTTQRGEGGTERGRETEAERRISIRISQERTDRPTSCECATATGKGCTIARESLARTVRPGGFEDVYADIFKEVSTYVLRLTNRGGGLLGPGSY